MREANGVQTQETLAFLTQTTMCPCKTTQFFLNMRTRATLLFFLSDGIPYKASFSVESVQLNPFLEL